MLDILNYIYLSALDQPELFSHNCIFLFPERKFSYLQEHEVAQLRKEEGEIIMMIRYLQSDEQVA